MLAKLIKVYQQAYVNEYLIKSRLPFSDPAHRYRRQLTGVNYLPTAQLILQVPDVVIDKGQHIYIRDAAALDDEIFVVFNANGHQDKIFVYSTQEMMSELEQADACLRRLRPITVPPRYRVPTKKMVSRRTIKTTVPPTVHIQELQVTFYVRCSVFFMYNN